jgi:hypothetical protein
MDVTWDDLKEATNLKKHGIGFYEAATAVLNPLSLYQQNKHPSEKRFEYIGYSDQSRILYVITVEENDHEVRIFVRPESRKA